ncbi:hypothetical protein Tco_0543140 [Tanacetum coccineum]
MIGRILMEFLSQYFRKASSEVGLPGFCETGSFPSVFPTTNVGWPRGVCSLVLMGNHASEETDNSYNADEAISYVPDESVELQRNTNDTAREDDHIKQMKETTEDDTTDVLEAAAKKTKETAKDAWEATKDTARKIKESVDGNSFFNIDDDVWEDHTGKPKIKGDDIMKP